MEIIKPVKHGGRKKGTPNRLTKEVRAVLKEVVFNEMLEVEKHFEKLDLKILSTFMGLRSKEKKCELFLLRSLNRNCSFLSVDN